MGHAKEKIILQPYYLLDYFKYVCKFVEDLYPDLLGPQATFIEEFSKLSKDAQCLYLRMNNRKGRYFRFSKFNYPEISNLSDARQELSRAIFTREIGQQDLIQDILQIFTKDEIHRILKEKDIVLSRSLPRNAFEEAAYESVGVEEILGFDAVAVQLKVDHVEMIKILFFGHPYGDLNQFVARDVGNVVVPFQGKGRYKRYFNDRAEVDELWQILLWYEEFKELQSLEVSGEALWHWIKPKIEILGAIHETSRVVSDKFLYRAGHALEREERLQQATELYKLSDRTEAYQRRLMTLKKMDDKAQASTYAKWLTENGKNASLKLLGIDYLARQDNSKKVQSTRQRLKNATLVDVKYDSTIRIERAVLLHLEAQGYQGFFSENYVWRSIFGLTFWDELYNFDSDAIHQPLQRIPSDLYNGFYANRKSRIDKIVQGFDRNSYLDHLDEQLSTRNTAANPFVHWHGDLKENIRHYLRWLSYEQVTEVLLEIAQNPKENATGFPDLFVFNENEYSFYEVKSPNDHLSAQQLFWLNFFETKGISAQILRTL